MTSQRLQHRTLAVRLFFFLFAVLLWTALARAQDDGSFERVLDESRKTLSALQKAVPEAKDDSELLRLRTEVGAVQTRVQEGNAAIGPQLAVLDARIAELGAAPTDGREPADIAAQRRSLAKARSSLDAQARLASLLQLEAEQTLTDIAERRRNLFQGRLAERDRSPLGRRFWSDLRAELPRDARRLATGAGALVDTVSQVPWRAWLLVALASAATLLARAALNRALQRLMAARQSHPSLRAFAYVAVWTIAAALLARWCISAIIADAEPSRRIEALLTTIVACAGFGAYITSLGATLLGTCESQSRWPLLPASVCRKLRGLPLAFAAALVATALIEQIAGTLGLTLATTVALEGALALGMAAVLGAYLYRVAPTQLPHWAWHSVAPDDHHALPVWVGVGIAVSWAMLVLTTLCVLLGYVALGSFIVKQFAWTLLLVCTAALLASVAANLITRLLTPKDVDPSNYSSTSRIASARMQAAVLFSAVAQIAIGFFALLMLLAPYGAGPGEFLQHAGHAQQGISIGELTLRPAELARAIVVLVLGFSAVRLAQRWLRERYLPLTRMDAGMRDSVASLAAYVGYVVVVSLALSALGVSLQQIAWVASALAVGIGFGLQAIVQNFVSGLILLAERPVRVGDWVSLGDIEGDVRRIHARATEIQKGDKSTVIVPNSEFITKSVRNVTYNSPLGLVQIKLPVPLGTDVERVRTELLAAFQEQSEVLRDPAPNVLLDGIEGTNVVFNATGFVRSPRMAYGARSAILFAALSRLRAADIELTRPSTFVMQGHADEFPGAVG